ncbi:MAG: EamA family transporter [Kiritimatiellae bacterium]|nr:EamA family transporter [Kiritimatiellia bacterium]
MDAGADREPGRRGRIAAWLWAAAAIVCWGVMFPVGDLLMKEGSMQPASVGAFRYLLASPILFAAGFALRGRAMLPRSARDWLALALLGLVGSAAMAQLLFLAQESVASVNASLLEAYVPMQVLLLAALGGARTTWRHAASVALGFAGCLLVLRALDGSGVRLAALSRGDLFVFLSGLCWAVYTAWGRGPARRLGGLPFTAWTVLFGALWLLAWQVASGEPVTPPRSRLEWGCVLFLAVFPTSVAFLGWNEAQKGVSLAHLSFLEYVPPLVAAVAGVAFFGETVTPWQWLGIAVVVLSARLLPRAPAAPRPFAVVERAEDVAPGRGGVVLAAGFFDGVHVGHRALLGAARDLARARGAAVWALTFEPHPLAVLAPDRAPPPLSPGARRFEALAAAGLDGCLRLPFTRELAALPPADFVARCLLPLARRAGRLAVAAGPNWRFGAGRAGSLADCAAAGIETLEVPLALRGGRPVSSTRVREAVAAGDLAEAAALLGRPYETDETALPAAAGRGVGSALGAPTANVMPAAPVMPPPGVYALDVTLPGETAPRRAVANYGFRPTFPDARPDRPLLEIHVPGFSGDLHGAPLRLAWLRRLRDERAFGSPDELAAQIAADAAAAAALGAGGAGGRAAP